MSVPLLFGCPARCTQSVRGKLDFVAASWSIRLPLRMFYCRRWRRQRRGFDRAAPASMRRLALSPPSVLLGQPLALMALRFVGGRCRLQRCACFVDCFCPHRIYSSGWLLLPWHWPSPTSLQRPYLFPRGSCLSIGICLRCYPVRRCCIGVQFGHCSLFSLTRITFRYLSFGVLFNQLSPPPPPAFRPHRKVPTQGIDQT